MKEYLKSIRYSLILLETKGVFESASILSSKLTEICRLIPALEKEIIWDVRKSNTARTRTTRDSVIYTFKNGSSLENVALSEKTRGQRFQAGLGKIFL